MRAAAIAFVLLAPAAGAAAEGPRVLDDLRSASAWNASASEQVRASLRRAADGSVCLDADFGAVSGYAVMRRELPVQWPANFDLVARVSGRGAGNQFQLKLVDASGDNVWWIRRPMDSLPARPADLRLKRRHVEFAWGPAADRNLVRTRHVELVVATGSAGSSTSSACLGRLTLVPRAPDPATWPAPAQRTRPGQRDIDFGLTREFNGVALRWNPRQRARDYELLAAPAPGGPWRLLRQVRGGAGALDTLFLPEWEARALRVRWRGAAAAPALALRSATQWPDFNAVLAEQARSLPRGEMPRAFAGQQNYWTLVGVDGGGERSALMSEDGAVEVGRGGFAIEPALELDRGVRLGWAQAQSTTHSLREGHLPLPRVRVEHAEATLDIEAAADGARDAPELLARYTLHNPTSRRRRLTLLLAVRPWQVNPPQQFLATPGGASPIHTLAWDGRSLAVNGGAALRFTAPPTQVDLRPFDAGLGLARAGTPLPPATVRQRPPARPKAHARKAGTDAAHRVTQLTDPQRHASALLRWSVDLGPEESRSFALLAPLGTRAATTGPFTEATVARRFAAAADTWRARLNRVALRAGLAAQPIVDTLRTALAHMLMSREGAALRPGTRSYGRTWIRDGAMMAAGLLQLGERDAAREFVDWFAPHVYASGKVPCCVGPRGADPVAENDSHGQYLYAVAEVWRHTRDDAWLARHWPTVQRVVVYQETLRQSERGERNRAPGRGHLFGLMPPSISHEGYSDRPAYSYWDDFWALRGYKDAVAVARALGHDAEVARWAPWRDEFERELMASLAAAAEHHRIGFVPGAADRGDFDATSTTVALDPAGATVPPELLTATFERYWDESRSRAEGRRAWKDYTPYELRSVGALLRLGQRDRAHAMLAFFFADQRPRGWNQWAEVVMRDPRAVHFLGDMPHAWVASDYVRSATGLFAYWREPDEAVVVGAGWLPEWLDAGVEMRGLSTPQGVLGYRVDPVADGWTLRIDAPAGMRARLAWPESLPLPQASVDGVGGVDASTPAWDDRRELALPGGSTVVRLRVAAPR